MKSPWRPLNGNPKQVVGQILGFKFSMYNKIGTEVQETPAHLFWVASLLIKHGILDLDVLYPHLRPLDEDVALQHIDYLKGLKDSAVSAGRYGPTMVYRSSKFFSWERWKSPILAEIPAQKNQRKKRR